MLLLTSNTPGQKKVHETVCVDVRPVVCPPMLPSTVATRCLPFSATRVFALLLYDLFCSYVTGDRALVALKGEQQVATVLSSIGGQATDRESSICQISQGDIIYMQLFTR